MDTKTETKKSNKILIPSILILGYLPLLMHQYIYTTNLSDFIWFAAGQNKEQDLFLGWKAVMVVVTGIMMMAILLYRRYRYHEKIKLEEEFYPFVIYGISAILSAVFSDYKYWVFCGSFGMMESIWVLLAYMVLCFYTYLCIQNEEQVHSVLKWSGIGAGILVLNGFCQYIGYDFFRTKIGRIMVSNLKDWKKISADVPKHVVCAPFYNQNNACVYFAMLIPIILALIICCKKVLHRVVLIIAEILAVFCLVGCISTAGMVALVAAMGLVVLVLMSRTKKTGIAACILSAVGVAGIVLLCMFTPIGGKVSSALLGTPSKQSLRSIDTTQGYIEMNINHQELFLTYKYDEETENFEFACVDEDGDQIPTKLLDDETGTNMITNILYLGCRITPTWLSDTFCVKVSVEDHDWFFTKDDQGEYYMFNQAGKWESYQSPEMFHIFNDYMMNGRGHIWNGALKAIADKKFIIGNGANSFLFVFPQGDYIYRAYNDIENRLDVKPHNIYLQQWIENGVFAMCAFFLFFLDYILKSIRIYRKASLRESLTWIGLGIFAGTVSYMIAGLANDSNLCTAPVFWVLIGVGIAINRIIKAKMQPKETDEEWLEEGEGIASEEI